MKISTSILTSKKIYKTISILDKTDTDLIHLDYIDNTFVEGKKISYRKFKKIEKYTNKRLDVHLMTKKLLKNIKRFAHLNCEYITFHIEATNNINKYIDLVKKYGIKVGLAINPDTDIELLKPFLKDIDLVLIMSVYPGYGGQKFIDSSVDKIKEIKGFIKKEKLKVLISVDGGINSDTYKLVFPYVNILVSGSYITGNEIYQESINTLRKYE